MRNVLAVVPKGSQDMVASIIRTIFAQPGRKHVRIKVAEVTRMLERSHPKVALMLEEAKHGLLASTGFPQSHCQQIWSTNTLVISSLEHVLNFLPEPKRQEIRDGSGC